MDRPLDPLGAHADWQARRLAARRSRAARAAGAILMAAALAWLGIAEAAALLPAALLLAAGGLAMWIGQLHLARVDARREARARPALRLVLAGSALKLAAIPLIAAAGGWLAWVDLGSVAAMAAAGLGLAAYAYGVVARLDGIARLPPLQAGV